MTEFYEPVIDAEGFRPNVGIIICDGRGHLLWAKRIGQQSWQFPQGGIDALTGMAAQDADYQAIVEALLESGDRYGRQAGTAASGALANRYGY